MDREQYIREAMRQLQDREFYRLLDKPIFLKSIDIIEESRQLHQ